MKIKVLDNDIYISEPSVLIKTDDGNILVNTPERFDTYLNGEVNAIYLTHGHDKNIKGIEKVVKYLKPNTLTDCYCSKITQRHVERIWHSAGEYLQFKELKPYKKNEIGFIPLPCKHIVQHGYDFNGFIYNDVAFITPIYDLTERSLQMANESKYIITGCRYIRLTKYQDNQSLTQILKRYKDTKAEKILLLGISKLIKKDIPFKYFKNGETINFSEVTNKKDFIKTLKNILLMQLKEISFSSIKNLDNENLTLLHFRLHKLYRVWRLKKNLLKVIFNKHIVITKEMTNRNMKNPNTKDRLEELTIKKMEQGKVLDKEFIKLIDKHTVLINTKHKSIRIGKLLKKHLKAKPLVKILYAKGKPNKSYRVIGNLVLKTGKLFDNEFEIKKIGNSSLCVRIYKGQEVLYKKKPKKEEISKPAPDVTENYIRFRIREPNLFVKGSFRTTIFSETEGIKSIMGKLKKDPQGSMRVQSILFDKKKWDMARAREWIKENRDSLKNFSLIPIKKHYLKSFDLPAQEARSELADKMIEKVLGVSVFKQEKITKTISPYKIAIYSKALQNFYSTKENKVIDLKWGVQYVPATFELLETKRNERERLLISGYVLIKGKHPLVIRYTPGFRCQILTTYCRKEDLKYMEGILQTVEKYTKDNNYYKNEKITPFGNFLPLISINKSDVILEKETITRLDKTVFNFFDNQKKYEKANIPFKRGVIFAGLPGTGKTLSGKVIMNNIPNVTFIWVTARDFKCLPTEYLFDMARELQPAVLFVEDVDRVLTGSTLDTIKTQMDGLESNEGILTILSTNFPEELPKTLIDRPGRFDDVIEFNLPDEKLRLEILSHYSKEMGINNKEQTLSEIAKISEGLTPAHLKEILVSAYMNNESDSLNLKDLQDSFTRIQQIHEKFKRN